MVSCFSAGTACLILKSTGLFVWPLAVSALHGMWPLARIPSEKFPHRQVFVAPDQDLDCAEPAACLSEI